MPDVSNCRATSARRRRGHPEARRARCPTGCRTWNACVPNPNVRRRGGLRRVRRGEGAIGHVPRHYSVPTGVIGCLPRGRRVQLRTPPTMSALVCRSARLDPWSPYCRRRCRCPMSRIAVRHPPGVAAAIRKRGVRDVLRAVGRGTRVSPIRMRVPNPNPSKGTIGGAARKRGAARWDSPGRRPGTPCSGSPGATPCRRRTASGGSPRRAALRPRARW